MGKLLKILAGLELAAAVILAAVIAPSAEDGRHCRAMSDILAQMSCERTVDALASGQKMIVLYLLIGGAIGALLFYALGHIVTLVEEIHWRVHNEKVGKP